MARPQHTDRYKQLCGRLAEIRKKGLTQEKAASRLGNPQSYISKYESGERRLDVVDPVDITKAVEVSPALLATCNEISPAAACGWYSCWYFGCGVRRR
jgi:transcriptional regulator with XRE-family HTH domain